VLDEPTNHLDIEMLETLEGALEDYQGTLLMISHDRTLVEHLADRIWLIEDGEFYEYPGGYAYYKEKHRPKAAAPESLPLPAPAVAAAPRGKGLWALRRQTEELEAEIARLERELEAAHLAIAAAGAGADYAALGRAAHELDVRLEARMDEWTQVQGELEARA
jgi:ATP-binding cassette, subfamily F, member 3